METGLALDEVAVVGEGDASFGDHGVEVGERIEVPVDDGFVHVDPEGLGGLQLGGVCREVDETDALGHDKTGRAVPAGVVEPEEDDAVSPGAGFPGEEREHVLEVALGDAGGDIPKALAGGGRDEGGDVEPLEAMVAAGDRALAAWRPGPA